MGIQNAHYLHVSGHDTTASGISWTLYNLACHPEIQEKVRKEVEELLGARHDLKWLAKCVGLL